MSGDGSQSLGVLRLLTKEEPTARRVRAPPRSASERVVFLASAALWVEKNCQRVENRAVSDAAVNERAKLAGDSAEKLCATHDGFQTRGADFPELVARQPRRGEAERTSDGGRPHVFGLEKWEVLLFGDVARQIHQENRGEGEQGRDDRRIGGKRFANGFATRIHREKRAHPYRSREPICGE